MKCVYLVVCGMWQSEVEAASASTAVARALRNINRGRRHTGEPSLDAVLKTSALHISVRLRQPEKQPR